jgi:hypothetical protein
MRNLFFCDVTQCGSCENRFSEEFIASIITVTGILKMEALRPSETSVHTRARRRHILEDRIFHSATSYTSTILTLGPRATGVCGSARARHHQTGEFRRMVSSGMLRRVDLVRTDVSEELSASFIRVN